MFPLFRPLVAFVAGILLSPCVDPLSVWLCAPLAALLGLARRWCLWLAVFLTGAGLAARQDAGPADLGPEPVRLIGRVLRPPERRGLGVYLDIQLQSVDARPVHGRVRLTEFLEDPELRDLFNALDLGTGDQVEIVVKLHRPAVYRNPGVFDYRRYLARQGVYWTGTIRNPRLITVLKRGGHHVDHFREWIYSRLDRGFQSDPNTRGLVMGMVLGLKHNLTGRVEESMRDGGLYHLVVASGFNLAVIAAAAARLTRLITGNLRIRLAVVTLSILVYVLVVGGQTPIIRAAVMALIFLAAKALDRGYAPLNAAALAALMLLAADPSLIEDSSFRMTFAAVGAVVGFGVPASRWFLGHIEARLRAFDDASRDGRLDPSIADWRVERRMWCELHGLPYWAVTIPWRLRQLAGQAFIVSVCVEMVFVYFMVESFHMLSPISPLLNIPAGLIAAVITTIGFLLIPAPGFIADSGAWIIDRFAGALLMLLDFGLSMPLATLRVPSAPPELWLLYALALSAAAAAVHRRKRSLCIGSFLAIVALQATIAVMDFSPPAPNATVLTFLDVGQGDSTLVEFPDGKRMLIDGGGAAAGRFLSLRDESTFSIGEDVVSSHLFSRRLRRVDALVLTHAHHDHLDGLLDVIENFKVGELWLGRNPMIPAYRSLIERAQERQIPIRWMHRGDAAGSISVLHPPRDWRTRTTAQNNDSLVLLLAAGGQTALLTGDLEIPIVAPDRVDVLKVPHHGSGGSRLRTQSGIRVISVGASNPFGHPHSTKLPALRTDELGAIRVVMDGAGPPKISSSLTRPCPACKLALLF